MKKTLRDYQSDLASKGVGILRDRGLVYLCMSVRTGKTATSMQIAKLYGAKSVLFLTKKKAMSDILSDYLDFGFDFSIEIMNDESMHKCVGKYDLVIHDEHHRCFLGNTLIDGVEIKNIPIGSFQKSFNFAEGIYEYKKVLNVFKNPLTEDLIKIICNGKEIVCTKSHKIFTRRGWVKAGELLSSDELQVV